MTKSHFDLVAGEEPTRTCVLTMSESHVMCTGSHMARTDIVSAYVGYLKGKVLVFFGGTSR
jgi:hypothetical protein